MSDDVTVTPVATMTPAQVLDMAGVAARCAELGWDTFEIGVDGEGVMRMFQVLEGENERILPAPSPRKNSTRCCASEVAALRRYVDFLEARQSEQA